MMGPFDVFKIAEDGELLKHVMQRRPSYEIVNDDRDIVFLSWTLWEQAGRAIELHKFYRADMPDCFHTHPAKALRMIVQGGYTEEVHDDGLVEWAQGEWGFVEPEFTHRIDRLRNGEPCVTLWWRERRTHPVRLVGRGWGDREHSLKGEEKVLA